MEHRLRSRIRVKLSYHIRKILSIFLNIKREYRGSLIDGTILIHPKVINLFLLIDQSLRFEIDSESKEKTRIIGSITGGLWDLFAFEVARTIKYKSLLFRYKYCYPWSDTLQSYSTHMIIRDKGVARGQSFTYEDFEQNVLYKWDQLYAEIRTNGYKSAEELGRPTTSNIEVAIGRTGRIYLVDGKHRLIIAQLLNLDYVPVVVSVIHSKVYRKLQRMKRSDEVRIDDLKNFLKQKKIYRNQIL